MKRGWLFKEFILRFQINMCGLFRATTNFERKQGKLWTGWSGNKDPVSELCWYPCDLGQILNFTVSASIFSAVKWEVDLWPSNAVVTWATFYLFAKTNNKETGIEMGKPWSWIPAFLQISWVIVEDPLIL